MNNELTLEQLRFAQLNGLTFYTGGSGTYDNHQFLKDINGKAYCLKDNGTMFKAAEESAASLADVYKINFAPLDEDEQTGPHRVTSDGSTASYYELPSYATELQHLISYRNMNAQDGEIFRAIYRKGRASHSDELRDAKKVLFYAKAEVERLERAAQELEK